MLWNTNANNSSVPSEKVNGLGIGLVYGCADDDGLGLQPAGDLLDLFLKLLVGELSNIKEMLSSALLDKRVFVAGIKSNDPEVHALSRNLNSQVAKSAASAGNDNPVSWFALCLSESGIRSQTGAKHWCCVGRIEAFWNRGNIAGWSKCVFLEGSWIEVSRNFLVETSRVETFEAGFAGATGECYPLSEF